eukprot:7989891-Alexandrium_andersonii.AAC.1
MPQQPSRLPFFIDGRKVLVRHAVNKDRDQANTREKYKGLILKMGLVTECSATQACVVAALCVFHVVASVRCSGCPVAKRRGRAGPG